MEPAAPQKEHAWLKQLVGEWTFTSAMPGGADQPPATYHGSETVRMLGDLWAVGEGTGEMPGGCTGRMLITIGFDPKSGRYIGTWVGSMMNKLWVYDGEVVGDTLNLYADGPSFADPTKPARYRDAIQIVDPDHRIFTGAQQNADGTWTEFMRAEYRRKR